MNAERRRAVLANISAALLVAGAAASCIAVMAADDSSSALAIPLGLPPVVAALVIAGVAWREPRAKFSGALAAVALIAGGGVAAYEFLVPPPFAEVDNSELPAEFQRLVSLHTPLGRPQPDEWLDEHPEVGQSYRAYVDGKPVRPDDVRRVIYVQPLGEFTAEERRVVNLTAEFLGLFYQLPVRVNEDLPLSVIPDRARRKVRPDGTPQFVAEQVLPELKPRLPPDAVALIALTTADLHRVLGRASLLDRVGVWSIYHLGDPAAGGEEYLRLLRRTLHISAHETGHMFSIHHCIFYQCCMNGSNHLGEMDRQPLWLCPQCQAKVAYATGVDPAKQFADLAVFAETHGLIPEAAFWRRSLATMQEP